MAPQACKFSLPSCKYAEALRCSLCGKDQRPRKRGDSRTTATYRQGLPALTVPHVIGVDGEGHDGRYFLIGTDRCARKTAYAKADRYRYRFLQRLGYVPLAANFVRQVANEKPYLQR